MAKRKSSKDQSKESQQSSSAIYELETDIESSTTEILRDTYGVLSVKLVMIANSGWPDRIYFGPNGALVFVEWKRGGNDLSPRQRYIRKLLNAFGFTVQTHRTQKRAIPEILKALGLAPLPDHR